MIKILNLILFVFLYNNLISQKELYILSSDVLENLDEKALFVEKKGSVFTNNILTKIERQKYILNTSELSIMDTLIFCLKTTKFDYQFEVPINKINSYEVYSMKLVLVGRRFIIKQYNIQLLNNSNEVITPFYAKRKHYSKFHKNITLKN